ncbi:MAG: metallophosphoesterase [Clostridia bacterium]|nr:metallophosphoesterase [Clostridia bacterium]
MKIFKKLFSATLVILTVVLNSFAIVQAAAPEGSGLTFSADALHMPQKAYEQSPNTFEAIVNFPTNMNSSTRGGVILGNYGAGNPNVSFEVYSNGNPRLYITDASGNVTNLIFNQINLYNGRNTHVSIVRDASAQKAHCYINGELAQSLNCAYTQNISVSHPLVLGGDVRSGNEQYFKGSILSAALYSNALSQAEIKASYENGFNSNSSTIAYYDTTDCATANSIPDLSGNGYDMLAQKTWFKDKEPVTDYAYSFAVIGDTQVVANKHPEEFHKIYDYILDNIESKNIKFVFGLGDITETFGVNDQSASEWELAVENIFRLDGKVPYSVVRGNHDDTAEYIQYLPYSHYESVIAGSYDKTMLNTYQLLTVGDIKYLMLTLDYGASSPVLSWAEKIIEEHPDHNVIITTHAYLYRDGTTLDQGDVCPPATSGGYNNGDHMWEILMKRHENIVLVMSGHDPCDRVVMAQDKGKHGNTVTQLLIDPQGVDAAQGATGLVAMLYFSEDGKNVTLEYYSTVKEEYFMTANQFSFTLDLAGDPVSNDDDGDDTSAPVKKPSEKVTETAKVETEVTEVEPELQEETEKSGCGSTLGAGTVILVTGIGASLIAVKKPKRTHKK